MRLDDFRLHGPSGVRIAPDGAAPAGYLDGAERTLLEELASVRDLGVASEELRGLQRDWATLYHLTPYRSTLFDCLGFTAGSARVLELGAGCGAVTRWLGEHCAEVHSVEGSPDRAQVARARCRELDNVSVYAANYSQLAERDRFDVVTLIGVLEYGHLYHPETDDPHAAALANLQVARRALHGDGVLVLAIENKLGLKYLSGAREDHSGRPFDSVEGYPAGHGTAVTFSARELETMLAQAGFAQTDWYVPFPDYKLARTVVNVQRAADELRVDNWLEGPAPDRGFSRRGVVAFNESLAQREVARAGLVRELANSFLVVAYAGDAARANERLGLETEWTVRHYSLDRRADCRKRVTLAGAADAVEHAPAFTAAGRDAARGAWQPLGAFSHRFRPEPFQTGELLSRDVLAALAVGGEAAVAEHVRALGRWLIRTHGTGGVDDTGVALLDGGAIDALWWNVVVEPERGAWVEIDREWRFEGVLPADYVLWRGLVHLHHRFAEYLPEQARALGSASFAGQELARALGGRSGQRIAEFVELEQAFAAVTSGVALEREPAVVARLRALADAPVTVGVLADADELLSRPELLRAYCAQFGPDDRVTLQLRAAQVTDELAERLQAAIDDAAAGASAPDMLLGVMPGDGDDVTIAAGAIAVLSERTPAAADVPPYCGAADLAALRTLVEQRWDALPAAA